MSYIVTKQDVNSKRWTSITSDSTGQYLAACVYSEKIWTSIDYGKSWSSNNNSPNVRWVSITSDSTGQYLAACAQKVDDNDDNNGYIYTSRDYGKNWSSNNKSSGKRNWYSITSDYTGQYLAACNNGGFIYTSIDSGINWSSNIESSGERNWYSITSDSTGQYLAACNNYGFIYTSRDYGKNWKLNKVSGNKNWYSITSDSTGQYLAAITGESEIYTSSDYGINWITTNEPLGYGGISIASSSDGTKIIAGCYLNYYVSTNRGKTWKQNYTGYDYSLEHVASNSSGSQFVACDDIGYIFTLTYKQENVTDVTFESGSEIVNFISGSTIVEKFTAIPGQLDTKLLEEGDYSDPSIRNIFERLKFFVFSDSTIDITKYNLAAFLSAEAYAQAYTEIVYALTDKYNNGEITLVEYNIALEDSAEKLAENYPTWYFNSLTKIEAAIIKYRYILDN
jgi:photosystem II stability/assembly factor-like uncharacterized protein